MDERLLGIFQGWHLVLGGGALSAPLLSMGEKREGTGVNPTLVPREAWKRAGFLLALSRALRTKEELCLLYSATS